MSPLQIIQLVLFSIGTLFLIYISYKPLKSLQAHGFYRFFVFESILILILRNIPYWFTNPFSIQQIASWIILMISLYLVYQSFRILKKIGGSQKREDNSTNFQFENTVNLVKEGVYKYIRHPMYSSLLFLCFGVFLKNIDIYTAILAVVAFLFLILTARIEEKENISYFGDAYKQYIMETKMFIPIIF
jgi:protein-S-isoprenylcysteine O-methyltransferase Ste14